MDSPPERKTTECAECGATLDAYSRFCGICGAPSGNRLPHQVWPGNASYRISIRRIILMSFLSQGLYLIYWVYFTRKQYLEHVYADADPSKRVFTISSIYAHVRSLRELLESAGVVLPLNVGTSYLLIFTYLALITIGSLMNGDFPFMEPIADWAPGVSICLKLLGVILLSSGLIRIQISLNRYWERVNWGRGAPARISLWEIALAIWGCIAWSSNIAILIQRRAWEMIPAIWGSAAHSAAALI